ncbi:DUF1917-domain-containing protein [Rhizodiscina lignyota]|uniref:DUF1917-domain-containing protein n=1 Tax=Rhizodiscina lignyota TaxID=1504668 RepID=A0A9P4IMH7_9PEZI|nr:DUF1917-domain-containing protein [Rhizodiscina lignyota]
MKEDMVDGAGWISDESSFYGDEEEKSEWEQQEEDRDIREYWALHPKMLNTMAFKARPTTAIKVHDKDGHLASAIAHINGGTTTVMDTDLHSGFEGWPHARQLSESVPEFLKRVHPLDISWAPYFWIWIANPYSPAEGSEDHSDISKLEEEGERLLDSYRSHRASLQADNPEKPAGSITRMLKPERDALKQNIEDLAIECKVLSGKWMLRPKGNNVPRVWRLVCEAISENRLGPTAKIATNTDRDEDDGVRVICVYTRDFTDMADIKRVAQALDTLGLVPKEGNQSIYYKPDVYTHLGINYDNSVNLRASLYSSKDILASDELTVSGKRGPDKSTDKERARKKPATTSSKGKGPTKK